MRYPVILAIAPLLLALAPGAVQAQIHKCVGANGTVSFSDQPCAPQKGEKAASLNDNSAFASLAARENDLKIGRTCVAMSQRQGRCSVNIDYTMTKLLRELCVAPAARFERERANERNRAYRNSGRYSESREYGEWQEMSEEQLRCGTLQPEMWQFMKDSFGSKISAEDMRRFDYNVRAVPSDGRELVMPPRRKHD